MKVLSQSELDAILSGLINLESEYKEIGIEERRSKRDELVKAIEKTNKVLNIANYEIPYHQFLKCNPNIAKEDYSYYDNCIAYFFEKLSKYNGSYDYKKKDDEKYKLGLKCITYISQKGSEVLNW